MKRQTSFAGVFFMLPDANDCRNIALRNIGADCSSTHAKLQVIFDMIVLPRLLPRDAIHILVGEDINITVADQFLRFVSGIDHHVRRVGSRGV